MSQFNGDYGSEQRTLNTADNYGNTARNTLTEESLTALRDDFINVQFQYNLPVNEDSADIDGAVTGTGVLSHANAKAIVGTGAGVGSAYVVTRDSIRYFPGHEFYGEMTAFDTVSGDLSNTNLRWGIGDPGGIGDSINYIVKDGVFGIEFRTGGASNFTPSADFNGDKLDGNGLSGKAIQDVLLNLWTFKGGWYGILPLQFGVYAGADVGYINVHTIDKTNTQTVPHLSNATLPMYVEAERTAGSGDNITVSTSSIRGGIVGPEPRGSKADRTQTITVEDKAVSSGALPIPVLTLRNNPTYQGKQNHVRVRYGTVSLAVDGTKPVIWEVFKNGALTGAVYVAKNAATSVIDYDITATAITPIADSIGGTLMGKSGTARINLFEGDVILAVYPGEEITLTARSTGNTVVDLFFRWIEEF